MRSYDLSPLYRATVGFDRMMNLLDSAARVDESAPSYPPYNIEKIDEDSYRISMAVAGFAEEELDITVTENSLVISGKKDKATGKEAKFLHQGIANRSFQRSFELADHIRIAGAALENGLLHIELAREVPEAMKPRSIKIEAKASKAAKVIEDQAA
ncbi:Hsp20 family protein [Pelagibius sp. Alg239-R121]|uniref:Hsp20 family protein n=1 Tax=Pelagibius sp. Alg239-R121 TaxID=2993448 RepID=UPI0024A6EDF2|nr:Hsp20 family protein [Pelagibius sp. Alg239-R121]